MHSAVWASSSVYFKWNCFAYTFIHILWQFGKQMSAFLWFFFINTQVFSSMKTIVQINISLGLINDYKCDPFKSGKRKYCTKDKFCIICSLTYKCMLWMKTKYLSLHKWCDLYQQKSTLSCCRSVKTKQSILCASLRLWARTLFLPHPMFR